LLARLISRAPATDPRVRVRPGLGLDCAVVDLGGRLLVFKSDPITFVTDDIGWYLVQVNANDLATTGAAPRWLLLTMLLPEGSTTSALVEQWAEQVYAACRELGIDVIGGHTEVTYGLTRPILAGTLIGEVEPQRLVTPRGARPGDRLLLTKGVPIEATALLAREFPGRLEGHLSPSELAEAQAYLTRPGLSVLRDASLAAQAGRVSAMHDPTEGGLAGALWELSEACGHALWFDPVRVPVPPLAARVCAVFGLDPLAAMASGALLLAAPQPDAAGICAALASSGIACAEIGAVEQGPAAVWRATPGGRVRLPRPARDEVARVFDGIE
jgi:hydrogenase expression/formation protein HypE